VPSFQTPATLGPHRISTQRRKQQLKIRLGVYGDTFAIAFTWWEAQAHNDVVNLSSSVCANAGSSRHMRLKRVHSLECPPSTAYAASVHGAPMNPIKLVLPAVSFLSVCKRKGVTTQ
jgi:hypothetical protein